MPVTQCVDARSGSSAVVWATHQALVYRHLNTTFFGVRHTRTNKCIFVPSEHPATKRNLFGRTFLGVGVLSLSVAGVLGGSYLVGLGTLKKFANLLNTTWIVAFPSIHVSISRFRKIFLPVHSTKLATFWKQTALWWPLYRPTTGTR